MNAGLNKAAEIGQLFDGQLLWESIQEKCPNSSNSALNVKTSSILSSHRAPWTKRLVDSSRKRPTDSWILESCRPDVERQQRRALKRCNDLLLDKKLKLESLVLGIFVWRSSIPRWLKLEEQQLAWRDVEDDFGSSYEQLWLLGDSEGKLHQQKSYS